MLALIGLAGLGWFVVEAGTSSAREHLRYARDLREIRQVDAGSAPPRSPAGSGSPRTGGGRRPPGADG